MRVQIRTVANKTIYIREDDLPLWAVAQEALGESISTLFARFLRERLACMDTFVHVLHTTDLVLENGQDFVVLFAPVRATGQGCAMRPYYVSGAESLVKFLTGFGVSQPDVAKIASDLETNSSTSVRTNLQPYANSDSFRLYFRPTLIGDDTGGQRLLKVDAIGVSASGRQLRASFHELNNLLDQLETLLGLPLAQLAAIRRSLGAGQVTELGGITGVPYSLPESSLVELGMVAAS
jgi:hypothetical protein